MLKFNFISVLSLLFVVSSLSSPTVILNAQEENVVTYKTVDEDLKEFNFDYKRYLVDESLVYRPIIINFNESLSPNYSDLLYVYDPNNLIDDLTISYDVSVSSDGNGYSVYNSFTKNIYLAGLSSDGLVKRYALNGYENYRNNLDYREYQINELGGYSVDSIYRFGPSNTLEYGNSLNMYLEDPHNWSWHFDEDNWWQNVSDWFSGSDVLKDQLFYSFKIPDGWDVNQIESIDIQYKKALLEGYRATVADNDETHNFYQNTEDENYKPIFYKWNSRNSYSYLDKSSVLGNSVLDIGNKIDYIYKTIEPSSVTSIGGINRKYKWKRIQHVSDFKKAFGEKSDIYNFVSSYYVNDDEDYWIINYDDFFYNYESHSNNSLVTYSSIDKCYYGVNSFGSYLINNGANIVSLPGNQYSTSYYHFTEEYTFDISARYITYRDSLGIKRSAAVSVAPVMEKEGSGGTSESPFPNIPDSDDIWDLIILILSIIGIALITIGLIWLINKTSSISSNKRIKDMNKKLDNLYKDKPKK